MDVYTIGFTRKTAAEFFGLLRHAGVKRLVDVRLHNSSQLAGFSKSENLPFFLRELCDADYIHEPLLAPSPELFDAYKKRKGSWYVYEQGFRRLLAERTIEQRLDRSLLAGPSVLLCTEPTAERCHRRLVLEYLADTWGDITPVHL